ncbi:hypothetical protein LEMLEM_LOCUS12866, partial [Lemmus lemmus]
AYFPSLGNLQHSSEALASNRSLKALPLRHLSQQIPEGPAPTSPVQQLPVFASPSVSELLGVHAPDLVQALLKIQSWAAEAKDCQLREAPWDAWG